MRACLSFLLCLLAGLLPGVAFAQASSQAVETGHALSRLVAEKAGIAPGETVRVGLYQELEKGWHVYWINPGDSGLPLEMEWTLPEGFAAGEIDYPLPHRQPLGPLVNYGYEGTPLFMVDITAPADAEPGMTAHLTVDADWLICEEICVPEEATLSLSLPVVAEPAGRDPFGGPLFAEGDRHMPGAGQYEARWFDLDGAPVMEISGTGLAEADTVSFFPYEQSVIEPAAEQVREATDDGVRLYFTPSFAYDPDADGPLAGIVALQGEGGYSGSTVSADRIETPAGAAIPAVPGDGGSSNEAAPPPNLAVVVLLALLGGLVLNIMPCVFPVIFIKAASLARAVQESRATVVRHGVLYTLGVLVAFLAIAGALMALRAGGEQVGWGFHLQSPVTVAVFAVIIFLVGLNLAGVFEIGTSVQGVGSGLAAQGGNAGAFFTGLLAVAVAAPCIGPFLGAPLGFAVLSDGPGWVGFVVFMAIGLGLALPYLLISLVPGLARILPKPGPWMETFKQVMSFAMFATLAWLVWVLTEQTGTYGLVMLMSALLLIGFAAWAFGRAQGASGGWAFAGRGFALAALAGGLWVTATVSAAPESALEKIDYSEATLAKLRDKGTPVFIDFTAAWCITCQANKRTVLMTEPVIALFDDKGVTFMEADWTLQDEEITRALEAQGRSGVPLYLFYAPGASEPVVLPQVLSEKIMRETFSVL